MSSKNYSEKQKNQRLQKRLESYKNEALSSLQNYPIQSVNGSCIYLSSKVQKAIQLNLVSDTACDLLLEYARKSHSNLKDVLETFDKSFFIRDKLISLKKERKKFSNKLNVYESFQESGVKDLEERILILKTEIDLLELKIKMFYNKNFKIEDLDNLDD